MTEREMGERREPIPHTHFRTFKDPALDAADTLLEWIFEAAGTGHYGDIAPKRRLEICRAIVQCAKKGDR